MTDNMRISPQRNPQWRWRRAENIMRELEPPTTPARDGPEGVYWIRQAQKLLRLMPEHCSEMQRIRIAETLPDLFFAWSFWNRDTTPQRWAIEAHILARETNREIAYKLCCSEATIEAYENLFFHVRDRLDHREYILHTILGRAVTHGVSERDYDLLWKMLAYAGGPHVLDACMSRLPGAIWAPDAASAGNWFQDLSLTVMKYRAAMASLTVPLNSHTCLPVLDAFVKCVEIERNSDSAGQAQNAIMQNLGAMLESLPFGVANDIAGNKVDAPDADYLGVELRSDELLIVGSGCRLPYAEQLEKLEFPPLPTIAAADAAVGTAARDAKEGEHASTKPGRRRKPPPGRK